MVRLKSQVFYLNDPDIIHEYSNIRLRSKNNEELRLNLLILAALKSSLVKCLHDQDKDHLIITEFSKEELESVLEYSLKGNCDNEKILQAFGLVPVIKGDVKEEPTLETISDDIEDPDLSDSEWAPSDTEWNPSDTELNSEESVPIKKPKVNESVPYLSNYPEGPTKKLFKSMICKVRTQKSRQKKSNQASKVEEKFVEPVLEAPAEWQFPKPLESYRVPPLSLKLSKAYHDQVGHFKCSKCPRKCHSMFTVKKHEIMFHSEHYKCPHCKKVFALYNVEDFRVHIYRHTINDIPSFKCKHCDHVAKCESKLQAHFKESLSCHGNECVQCPYELSTYEDYQEHIEKCHDGHRKFKCRLCNEVFDTRKDLKSHHFHKHTEKTRLKKSIQKSKKKILPSEKNVCEECGKYVGNLRSHMIAVHSTSKSKCPECPKVYRNETLLKAHMKNVHIQVQCTSCGDMVAKGRLNFHLRQKHVDILERKFKCEYCGKSFVENNRLKDHVNIHTGEKPYKCKFCNASFANKANRAAHERSHLGVKRKT